MENSENGSKKYKFAGYSTLYRFYNYPDRERIRIAHMLLIPPYRHFGIGSAFLKNMYADLKNDPKVYDITGIFFLTYQFKILLQIKKLFPFKFASRKIPIMVAMYFLLLLSLSQKKQ